MANVLSVVWFVVAWVVTLTSVQVWAALMLPNAVERARRRVVERPVPSFLLGLVVVTVTLLVGLTLVSKSKGLGPLVGWVLMAPMFAAGIVGGAAFARILAERIRRETGRDASLPALIGGALCTVLSGLLPIIGWVVFFPAVTLISVGAGTLALLQRKEAVASRYGVPAEASAPDAAMTGAPAHGVLTPAGQQFTNAWEQVHTACQE